MSRYLCCCRKNGSSTNKANHRSSYIDDIENPFQDTQSVNELNDLFVRFRTEYQDLEELVLQEDYSQYIPYVQIIRQNPDVILRQGAKYSSHILELARKRKFMISIRDRLSQFGEQITFTESDIENPMHFGTIGRGISTRASDIASGKDSNLSMRLSSKWTKRLVLNNFMHKVKPAWPDTLPQVEFDVIKHNRVGQALSRRIRLTEYHVLNLKDDDMLTKAYLYSDIARVSLEEGDSFNIDIKTGKRIRFSSHIAAHIVQQIIARIKFRLQIDRVEFTGGDLESADMSVLTTVNLIQQISMENAFGSSDAILAFSQELCQQFINTEFPLNSASTKSNASSSVVIEEVSEGIDEDESMVTEESSPRSNSHNSEVKVETMKRSVDSTSVAKSAKVLALGENIMATPQGSPEHDMQSALQQMIYSTHSDIGNTRAVFLETILKSSRSQYDGGCIREIRNFIDGMFRHILHTRGNELCFIYLLKSNVDTPKLESPDDFISALTESQLIRMVFLTEKCIEEAVLVPLTDVIAKIYEGRVDMDANVVARMAVLSKRQQSDWGIPDNFISPIKWQSAVFELSCIENVMTPLAMMNCLSRTAKAIYTEFKHAVLKKITPQETGDIYLGADDFVPIFLYVFCQSKIRKPNLLKDILWNLSHPSLLHGECGYYLTVLESAIECILTEKLSPAELVSYNDVLLKNRLAASDIKKSQSQNSSLRESLSSMLGVGGGGSNRNSISSNNNDDASSWQSRLMFLKSTAKNREIVRESFV